MAGHFTVLKPHCDQNFIFNLNVASYITHMHVFAEWT